MSDRKLIEMNDPELTEALRTFLFVFGGEDCGYSFVRVLEIIKLLEQKSEQGNIRASEQITDIKSVGRLLKIVKESI